MFYFNFKNTNSFLGMNDTLDLICKIITQKKVTCTILILGMSMNGSVGNIHKNDTL
jgi:hypothetical protein